MERRPKYRPAAARSTVILLVFNRGIPNAFHKQGTKVAEEKALRIGRYKIFKVISSDVEIGP